MFSMDDFAQLQFLEGRWQGETPQGKALFEQYERPEPGVFKLRSFHDASFTGHSDGATITFRDGEVVSQWNEYSWRASRIAPGFAEFEPVNAPSRFNWRRLDDSMLETVQYWTAEGKEQQYVHRMTRIS